MTNDVDQLQEFHSAILKFADTAVQILAPIFEDIRVTLEKIRDLFWQSYLEAGMPYGVSDDGMFRWIREVSEAHAKQIEAEYILSRHKMLADFRKRVEEKCIQKKNLQKQ